MATWFNQIRNFLKIETNPSKVIEVKQDKYSDRDVLHREDNIVLYGPDEKEKVFEILFLRPCNESLCSAFSLFRSEDLSEAETKFILFIHKIPSLLNICKDVSSVNGVQKICDVLHENPTWTIYHVAVHLNLLDVLTKIEVKDLINKPDPVSGLFPIHLAIKNSNLAAVKTLLKLEVPLDVLDHEGNTVHHFAAETNKDIISILSSKAPGLNYRNANGNTPLHVACLADKRDCVKSLLLAGADPNISSKPASSPSTLSANIGKVLKNYDSKLHEQDIKFGGTPLHWSCSKEVINDLLQNNCDINAINFNSRTALHIMVLRERLECALALLSHGCEINLQDEDGNTPLHIAALNKNVPILQALIVFGSDLNSRNKKNESARHLVAVCFPDINARKSVYILHSVGASRCTSDESSTVLKNCTDGCQPLGKDNGEPPPEPKCAPVRSIVTLYENVMEMRAFKGGRLLCLDGGGIRGLVLIIVLLHLQEIIDQPIIQCFDWVSGTSTGAILALALATGRSLIECLRLYFLMKEKTFVGSRPYPSDILENILKDIFSDMKMSEIKHPKLIITGLLADSKPADLHIFRNYPSPCDIAFPDRYVDMKCVPLPKPEEQYIWKAARASGAAPSYFRMFERFLDGGLVANNPTLDALTEIYEYNLSLKFTNRNYEIQEPTVVVSVGTGCIPVSEIKDIDVFRPENFMDGIKLMRGMNALGMLLVDQATLSDGRVVDRARAWCHSINVPFFRFSPQMSEEIAMDEKDDQKLVNMLWETKVYMVQNQAVVRELASILKNKY